MGRNRKDNFRLPKMLSSRIEQDDYDRFEFIVKYSNGKSIQEAINLFVTEMISGSIIFSGSHIVVVGDKNG
jgi:hypothetical protein